MPDNPFTPPALDGLPVYTRVSLRERAASEAARLAQRLHAFRWAEFGVREGNSAKQLLKLLPPRRGTLYLFDSWDGLPEDWDRGGGLITSKGTFACDPPEFSDTRCRIWSGLFEDSLPDWKVVEAHTTLSLVHLDCDLYSSTRTVLDELRLHVTAGTVLVFDDIAGYPNWRDGQWKAWREWIGDKAHTWLGRTDGIKPKNSADIAAAVRLDEDWRP